MSTSVTSSLVLPSFFSISPSDSRKTKVKKVFKIIWRVTKLLIFLTFFAIGLYGCFQTYVDKDTISSTTIGNGLELGFNIGEQFNGSEVIDPRFLLIYSGQGPWYPYSGWTMNFGPFYAFFVWPFAQLLLQFMYLTRTWVVGLNALLGIFLVLLIIRAITILVSTSSIIQSEKMMEIQGKLASINAKYKGATDLQSRQKKNMEIQALYKKANVRPFAMFEQIMVTLPIFLIVYRVVSIVRPLKYILLFGAWDLTLSPITQLFSNFTTTGWPYLFFILLVVPVQFISQLVPRWLAKKRNRNNMTVGTQNSKAQRRTKIITYVMSGVMTFIVIISPAGIGLYWFLNALFSMSQSLVIHKIMTRKKSASKVINSKLSKLGIA